jgi:hypothetical protein
MPDNLKTDEIYLIIVKTDGQILRFIPEDRKTYQICLEAVKNSETAMHHVPEKFRDGIMGELWNM